MTQSVFSASLGENRRLATSIIICYADFEVLVQGGTRILYAVEDGVPVLERLRAVNPACDYAVPEGAYRSVDRGQAVRSTSYRVRAAMFSGVRICRFW